MMRQLLPLVSVVALLVATGVGHGVRTDRWGRPKALEDAAEALGRVPAELGDWAGTDVTVPARHLEIADVNGHLSRNYVHKPTGKQVQVLIVCGRPGAVGAHTPDVCYQGAGFTMKAAPIVRTVKRPGLSADFLSAVASKEGPGAERLSIWWSWSQDLARWEAPRSPRWHFALAPVLYKVYLVQRVGQSGESGDDEQDDLRGRLLEQLCRSVR